MEIIWDNAPRSVPDDTGFFSVVSELCYFFKVFKINTPGDGDQEINSFWWTECSCPLWFSFWPFFQTVRPLVQVPGDIDSDCWSTFFRREDTLELQKLFQAQRGLHHSGALSKSCSQRGCRTSLIFFGFQKQELTKTIAARLGGDFEIGQSFNEFIYRASVLESGHC